MESANHLELMPVRSLHPAMMLYTRSTYCVWTGRMGSCEPHRAAPDGQLPVENDRLGAPSIVSTGQMKVLLVLLVGY